MSMNMMPSSRLIMKNAISSNVLLTRSAVCQSSAHGRLVHSSPEVIAVPDNILEHNNAEKIKFSPRRFRDTTSSQIVAKLNMAGCGPMFGRGIMATANSSSVFNDNSTPIDSHVPVYDQYNSVSLSSATETNVPHPFQVNGNVDRSGHLDLPCSQLGQNDKYVSSDLHDHHHSTVSPLKISKNKTVLGLDCAVVSHIHPSFIKSNYSFGLKPRHRLFSTSSFSHQIEDSKAKEEVKLTSGQKLKRAVKEYGTTVIVFHVTISLASLGLCYLLVSSGIDMVAVLKSIGIDFNKPSVSPPDSPPVNSIECPSEESADTSSPSADTSSPSADTSSPSADTSSPSADTSSPSADTSSPSADTSSPSDRETTTPVSISESSSTAGDVVAGVSTFVVAYAVHKVFAPLRIATTLASTPIIVRALRAKGILKPPKVN